jgi:hypothetical protein
VVGFRSAGRGAGRPLLDQNSAPGHAWSLMGVRSAQERGRWPSSLFFVGTEALKPGGTRLSGPHPGGHVQVEEAGTERSRSEQQP